MITQNTKKTLALPEFGRRRLGRYQLLDCLATGGMAQVFLALSGELTGFRTLVVVKRILPHLSSNKHFIRMFFDEARLAALLDHPNVVRIIEVGQDNEEYFLAMEAVQGRSLSSLVRRGLKNDNPLTHAQSAFIIAQAASGLGYAHNLTDTDGRHLQVVHRDVSPQNILISFDGTVKVIDFGVARALGRVTETRAGGIKGKINYMSPEQAVGGTVDRRSDVFSLGIVLWEALCGRRLFRRENERDALRAIVEEPIMPPSDVVRISPRLERIVMKALEKDPVDRYKTADEMALALERHAFTTEGFNPLQIGTTMKALFATDHARWKRYIAGARQMEGAPEQWATGIATLRGPPTQDPRTQGSTVVLHPETPPLAGAIENSGETQEMSRSPSTGWSVPPAPRRVQRQRTWMGALGLTMVAGAVVLFAFSRSLPSINTISKAARKVPSAIIEPLTTRHPRAPAAAAAAPAPPIAGGKALVREQPEPEARVVDKATVNQPAVAKPAVAKPAVAQPAYAQPAFAPRPEPASLAAVTRASRPPAVPSPRLAPLKHAPAAPRKPVPQRASPSASPPPPVVPAPGACTLIVGTRPWSEMSIDGRPTNRHTPFYDSVPCGRHQLTFKRSDLRINRTVTVTLYPGEPFKQSFNLD